MIPLIAAFELAGRIAFAQSESDPVAQLRACSLMERAERLECLDRLSRDIAAAPDRPPRGGDNWMISETTSPVDYTPIVTAITVSRGDADGSVMQLAIYCRGGRTELVVEGPAIAGKGDDYAISYRIDGNDRVQLLGGGNFVWNRRGVQRRYCALVAVAPRGGRRHRPDLSPNGCCS
jgi:hypothetical protein